MIKINCIVASKVKKTRQYDNTRLTYVGVLLYQQTRSQTISRSMEFANLVMLFLQPIFLQPKCEMEFVALYSTVVLSHMPHIGKSS